MLVKNKAIVLSKTRYRDNDAIVKCYTLNRGITSYIVRGAYKAKKSGSKIIYFQLLSQLLIEENYKPNSNLQYIKEVKLNYLYKSLHTNIYKSSIVLFLSEVLSSALKEEEENESLFSFIEIALQYLDTEEQFANFHLLFLLKLTQYLGFLPEGDAINANFFNLKSGSFENSESDVFSISGQILDILKKLLSQNFSTLAKTKISGKQRQEFLLVLLKYYDLHLEGFAKPKSIDIFNDIFH